MMDHWHVMRHVRVPQGEADAAEVKLTRAGRVTAFARDERSDTLLSYLRARKND
jgi:hypothetical protein